MLSRLVYRIPKVIRTKLQRPYSLYVKLKDIDKDMEVKTDYATFYINPMTYIGCSIFNRGVYEPDTSRIIDKFIEPGMTAIDVGASNGVHTLRMAKRVGSTGEVYAFEPSEMRFKYLEHNIKLNPYKNIKTEMKGVSNKHQYTQFKDLGWVRMDNKNIVTQGPAVEVVTLNDYVKKNMIQKVDFIKIDTDGWEYHIIDGMRDILKRDKPIIIMEMRETFHEEKTGEELVLLLSKLGYRFFSESTIREYINEEEVIDSLKGKVINVLCLNESTN